MALVYAFVRMEGMSSLARQLRKLATTLRPVAGALAVIVSLYRHPRDAGPSVRDHGHRALPG